VSVRKAFGKDIPPAAIFRSPTIQQLAALIRQREATNYWSSLVPVQPVGSKPPFFWIHGDFSSVFLSRHLGSDQPLYLLTHQSEDGKPARYKDVESIAEYYLREILTVQKAGPFFLGGYSFGGVVALEIAQQLTRQGEEVGLLTLLDPPPLNRQTRLARSNDRESINDTFRRHARALAALTVKEQVDYIVPRAKEMSASWMSPMRKAFRKVICRACVTFGWSIPLYMRSSYILGVYQQALNAYVPRPYSGPVLLFKGETRSYSSKLDWYELLNGRVETHMVSGDHTKLRERSYVSTWAGQLKPALLAARSAYSAQTPRGVHQ
jgi:thioesterase domain-containing protein